MNFLLLLGKWLNFFMTLYMLTLDITKKIKFGKNLLLLGIFASLLFMLLLGVGNF
jgi:hypothetical protein